MFINFWLVLQRMHAFELRVFNQLLLLLQLGIGFKHCPLDRVHARMLATVCYKPESKAIRCLSQIMYVVVKVADQAAPDRHEAPAG